MEELMRGIQDGANSDEEIPLDESNEAQDEDEQPHARLLDAIASLDGKKRLKHTLRTEPGQNMSEFGFRSQKVDAQTLMSEMLGSLQQSASYGTLKKQLKSAYEKGGAVETPAPKHIKEKAQRAVGYEKAISEVTKWDPVVTANRKAQQLKFPLEQANQKLINSHITFKPITSLEKEIEAELSKVKVENRIPKGKLFTPAEKKEMEAMNLEEAKERRAELMRIRAIMYTKASKLRWQNKIKSKRYRRALKKEKQKKMEKELEELAVKDPQALVDRLQETEMRRIEERGRLRHRGGGKFARQAKIFAKYDDEKRQEIQDMLAKHKELTKKQQLPSSSSDSEDETDFPPTGDGHLLTKNAWMQPMTAAFVPTLAPGPETAVQPAEESSDEGEEDFLASFQRGGDDNDDDQDEKNNKHEEQTASPSPQPKLPSSLQHHQEETAVLLDATEVSTTRNGDGKKKKKLKGNNKKKGHVKFKDFSADADIRSEEERSSTTAEQVNSQISVLETEDQDVQGSQRKKNKKKSKQQKITAVGKPMPSEEKELLAIVKGLQASDKDHSESSKKTVEEGARDEGTKQRTTGDAGTATSNMDVLMTIAEAFDDDDVVEEFTVEKQRVEEEEKEKDVDLFVPGWGRWGGAGIVTSEQVKKRFIKKAKPHVRADSHIGHVIISEKKNTVIEKHMLQKVPHPYRNLDHMKSVLSKSIGRDFNSETQFKKNIKPKTVVSRIGQVIQPINESALLHGGQKRKSADIELDQTDSQHPSKRKHKKGPKTSQEPSRKKHRPDRKKPQQTSKRKQDQKQGATVLQKNSMMNQTRKKSAQHPTKQRKRDKH